MNILIVGLGLIGGSFCRTIKKHTTDTVLGMDIDQNTVNQHWNQARLIARQTLKIFPLRI